MNAPKTSTEIVERIYALLKLNSAYGWGTWGHECTEEYIRDKAKQYPDHYTDAKMKPMLALAKAGNGWMFDCNGLIKGLLWGWDGSPDKLQQGGARYQANGFSDTNASGLMARCSDVTTDFSNICVGELVYKTGHIGVYIGNGMVAEATPDWKNGVQISALENAAWPLTGLHSRKWMKHGKLRVLDYRLKTGSLVDFVGDKVGMTQYGDVTRPMKKGLVKITGVFSPDADRPYHIMFDGRGTSNASGFVAAGDLR